MEFWTRIQEWLNFTTVGFWVQMFALAALAWFAVLAFMSERNPVRWWLSVLVPIAPVVGLLVTAAFHWRQIYDSTTFANPPMLTLGLLIPVVIILSMRSLAGLGPNRRAMAIALRCVIIGLLAAALAEAQFVKITDKLTVLFVLDYSRSIPREWDQWMRNWVNKAAAPGQKPGKDLAGVLFFGKTPNIEIPPLAYIELRETEGNIDRYHTDIAGALKLAQAAFSDDTMKRIVLVSDGNENRGEALQQALNARKNGITIDVVPVRYRYDTEVLVEKISVPADAQKGETVNLNVVVRATAPMGGTLRIFQKVDKRSELAAPEAHVKLQRGVNSFVVPYKLEQPNFYEWVGRFEPDDIKLDRLAENNEAQTFTHVAGTGRVLLIEGTPGEHDALVDALRSENIEVRRIGPDEVPDSLEELRPYDCVILANMPAAVVRTSENGLVQSAEGLSERQMEMIARNTHDLGAGLMMIGGPDSFGPGGYNDSPIEKALPVDMEVKSLKVNAKGALVCIFHASEIPEGNYWQKVVAKEAIRVLSPTDEAGVIHWTGREGWLFPLQEVRDKTRMLARIDSMTPGDMPDMDPSLIMARNSLNKSDAMTKHIILISDGDPTPYSGGVANSLANSKITVTTVGVAVHGNDMMAKRTLANLAKITGGRYYDVRNNRALPKIFQKEARIVSRPLIFEKQPGWQPTLAGATDPIAGLANAAFPPITGYVLTTPKPEAHVWVPVTSPLPIDDQDKAILAHWQYGLGKSVAFTSDAGRRWTTAWTGWEHYKKFWTQLVRWSMRSVATGNVSLATQRDGEQIIVTADVLDKENRFVNFAELKGTVITPDMKSKPLVLSQIAPGRYKGTIPDAAEPGTYFVSLTAQVPGADPTLHSTGVSVPYPAEFRELESNPDLLDQIALSTSGKVIEQSAADRLDEEVHPFRHDLKPLAAAQDLWPLLTFWAVILFFFDVAVRRIALDLTRVQPALAVAWGYVTGRKVEAQPPPDYMDKLRNKKAEVAAELDRARASQRFQPTAESAAAPGSPLLEELTGPAAPRPTAARPQVAPEAPQQPQDSYTSRLLKAKQKVWDEKKQS
jgi:uncharacterized membrane protein/Mg-chelatase subunit ChlD